VGDLSVPDPRVTNPELFDLRNLNAPIPQFVKAMGEAGIHLDPQTIAAELEKNYEPRQGADGKTYVLTTYTVEGENGVRYSMGLIAEQDEKGGWSWREVTWKDLAYRANIIVGVEVDPGHPNDHEQGYREFVYNHVNYFVVSGAMSHQWIQYGRTFVPELVNEYKRRNPEIPLTLGIGHMFYHHDTFPPELSDQSIPLSKRQELTREFMKNRVREIFKIVAPLMKRYPDLTLEFNLGNEVIWEYQGNTGWEGEYSNFPLYDNLGKKWLPEAYKAFEEVRKEFDIPRERFVILMNDWGIQLPGRKADYYVSQKRWIIETVAGLLGTSQENIQLDTGIQFGMGSGGANDVNPTRNLLKTPEGRRILITHLLKLCELSESEKLYFTEVVADGPEDIENFLRMIEEAANAGLNIGLINFWDALNRNFPGETIIKKADYSRLYTYYQLLNFLLGK